MGDSVGAILEHLAVQTHLYLGHPADVQSARRRGKECAIPTSVMLGAVPIANSIRVSKSPPSTSGNSRASSHRVRPQGRRRCGGARSLARRSARRSPSAGHDHEPRTLARQTRTNCSAAPRNILVTTPSGVDELSASAAGVARAKSRLLARRSSRRCSVSSSARFARRCSAR